MRFSEGYMAKARRFGVDSSFVAARQSFLRVMCAAFVVGFYLGASTVVRGRLCSVHGGGQPLVALSAAVDCLDGTQCSLVPRARVSSGPRT